MTEILKYVKIHENIGIAVLREYGKTFIRIRSRSPEKFTEYLTIEEAIQIRDFLNDNEVIPFLTKPKNESK